MGLTVGEGMICRLPPDYHQNDASEERLGMLARPAAVVTVAERLEDVDLEQGPPQDVRPVHHVYPSRRWGSMRRLMSSTESTL